MTVIDDIRASKTRLAAAQATAAAEERAAVDQLRGVAVTRLRPVAALSWLDDAGLTEACQVFALSAIQSATAVLPPTP
jgi:hypothetical protein